MPPPHPAPLIMRCRAVLVLTLLLTASWVTAQPGIDSLTKVLNSTRADTARWQVLLRLGAACREQDDFDKAKGYQDQAIAIARGLGDRRREAAALSELATTRYYQGNSTEALTYWEPALALLERTGDSVRMDEIRINMANATLDLGRADEAQHMLLDVLHREERRGARGEILRCLANLANVYALQGKLEDAIAYNRRVLEEFDRELDPFVRCLVLANLGQNQLDLLRADEAHTTFTELMRMATQQGRDMSVAAAHTGLGNAANLKGDRITARTHYLEALPIYAGAGAVSEKAVVQERLASVSREALDAKDRAYLDRFFHGDRDRALTEAHALADSAIVTFRELDDPDNLRGAYSAISEIERAEGNYKAALEHHIRFKDISDTLLNAERDKKLTERAMQYEFDKKQATAAAEQRVKDEAAAYELEKERTRRNILQAAGIVAVIFAAVSFRQRRRTQRALKRSDELLLNILPEEVADELKEKGHADAKHFETATILFTDFKGFTQLSEKVTPAELVAELNTCFKVFDGIMGKYRIEKIKTIGDAYMAAGGLPDPQHGSPADVLRAALEMQDFMRQHKAERTAAGKPYFEMRVGIHSGPVVAGIVGVKKFQYDIWGDTVNTASRMESSGEVGKVNISEATYALVKDEASFTFTQRGKVQAKGKGEMEMYFVEMA